LFKFSFCACYFVYIEMTDTVPVEIRPSQVSLQNINGEGTEQPASVPIPSPRTSSTGSSDDRNANIDASVALGDRDEGSSGDSADDFQDSSAIYI